MNITAKNGIALSLFSTVLVGNAQEVKQPNVVFILVDDMGWRDLGCFGSDFYQSPHIDKLAQDGVLFDNAYAACTVSSPTRASIMTGKYPAKLHLTDWIEGHKKPKAKLQIPDWTMYLPLKEITMAEVFKSNGYATGHFGKWHLGEDPKYWPENQGFDVNVGGWSNGSPNKNEKKGYNGYFTPYGNPRLTDGPLGEQLTERLSSEVCNYIENNKTKPFFINLWFYNVHTPLQAKAEKIAKYKALADTTKQHTNPVYAAMVEHVDDAVGEVVRKLKELQLYDNTIIVFTSDNGGLIGRGTNKVTNNLPIRSGKGDIYEGGVRVPLICKLLNNKNASTINHNQVISVDYLPTFIELAHLSVSDSLKKSMDGISIAQNLNNKKKIKRKAIYWHYPHYHTEGATPYSAIREGDWKLINVLESNTFELYNLKNDIGESIELSTKYPKKADKLKKDLQDWRNKIGAQMPTENPKYEPNRKN